MHCFAPDRVRLHLGETSMSIPFSVLLHDHRDPRMTDNDSGRLSWVIAEIRETLQRSRRALLEAVTQDAESRTTSLYHAKTHLHQAHGALQMVDLDGVTIVTDAIEQLLERLACAHIALTPQHAEIVGDAYQALLEYLEHVLSGMQQQALRLYPYHKAVLEALGAPRIHPADLFFAQLAEPLELPAMEGSRLPQALPPAGYAGLRQRFEMGLLPFLKNSDPASEARGATAMRAVIAEIEQAQTAPQARTFWWVMQGFAEAVCCGQIVSGRLVKQLFALLNLQIRHLAQGSQAAPGTLLGDALFFIAQIEQPAAAAQRIRDAYRIEASLPADYEVRHYGQIDAEALGVAKDRLSQAKSLWSRIAGGEAGSAESFEREMKTLAAASEKLNSRSLAKLLRELNGIARHAAHSAPQHSLCLEMATGLLFVEHALDNISHLGADFSGRADALSCRLISIVAGEPPAASAQWLDELSEQAQQRQTLCVLATEMQANVRQVEKSLEEFFSNPAKKDLLPSLEPVLHQIAGALALLEQNDALSAVERIQSVVRGFAASLPDAPPDRLAYQSVARNVSALGFFLEMLAVNPQAARNRFSFNAQEGIFDADLFEKSHPIAIVATAGDGNRLAADAQGAGSAAQSAVASAMHATTAGGDDADVDVDADAGVDAELLEIFISEAQEVLAFVSQTLPLSRQDSQSQEHLASLRRSFHTLKGSGRMVGLHAFGNAAWGIEQVMNLWLSEARHASAALTALLDMAVEEMQAWVAEIKLHGQSARSADALVQAAERVRNDQMPDASEAATMPPELPVRSVAAAEELPSDLHAEPDLAQSQPPKECSEDAAIACQQPPVSMPESAAAVPDAREPVPAACVIEFLPSAALPARPDDSVKRIGDIEVSVPLHTIYLAEADQIVRLLANDFSEWRHEVPRTVSAEAINAAHSLCGSSATVGFKGLYDLARALENLLQHLARQPALLKTEEFDVLDQSVAHCKSMLQTFAVGEMPPLPRSHIRLLESMHRTLRQRRASAAGDAVTEAAPQDALAAARLPSLQASASRTPQHDAIDADLVPVFIEEGRDLLPEIGRLLRAWQQAPADAGVPQALLRALHTLKGSARMAGAMVLGQHAHDIETRIDALMRAGAPAALALEELLASHDYSLELFEQLQHPASAAASAAADANGLMPAGVAVVPPAVAPLVRVRADIIDRLVNQAGEVSISRSRLEAQVDTARSALAELTANVSRLRSQLREIEMQAESQILSLMPQSTDREFDPLEFDRFTRLQELTRMMAESVGDVASVQQSLARTVEDASTDLARQARLTRDLQQDLMQVRMVPFASVSERLYQVARQAAKDVRKRVNLEISGGAVEIDRNVLEKMAAPFEHLLRNAIAHGIEAREQRRALGKNDIGELLLQVRQDGNEVVIRFSDDGQGLDLAQIRAKARSVGLLGMDSTISDADAMELVFQPGFSTAAEITALAGRGVGLDVVQAEVAALGGRVAISSTAGQGACFTMHLPLTLAVIQVVLLRSGGKTYALPSALVEQVQQLKSQVLASAYNEAGIFWQGDRVALHNLSSLLADNAAVPLAQQYSPLIILRSGNDRMAIHVDKVLGNREVVVKNIGPQLSRMVGIVGATVLGSGEIVLILNPVALALRAGRVDQCGADPLSSEGNDGLGAVADLPALSDARQAPAQPVAGLRTQRIVMVVDDSLTVRRVTQRLLTREGYQVALARDGVDALQQLQSITPHVMLVDIEMPRMDGFDLIRNVRSDERTRKIPIIMITSRTADKHRNYAIELGVDAYFGKPFQEDVLLQAIAAHTGSAIPAG